MSPILAWGLPALGVVHSFPRTLAHGPLKMADSSYQIFTPSKHCTDIASISFFLKQQHHSLSTAHMWQVHSFGSWAGWRTVPDTSSAARSDHKFLDKTYLDDLSPFGYLPSIGDPQSCLAMQGDIELTCLFISHGFCNVLDLIILNHCWMYLQAFWVSGIWTGSGDRIKLHIWNNSQPLPSKWTWSLIGKTILRWLDVVEKGPHGGPPFNWNQQSAVPLGYWNNSAKYKGWFFEPQSDCLWSAHNSTWLLHSYVPHRTRTKFFMQKGSGHWLLGRRFYTKLLWSQPESAWNS